MISVTIKNKKFELIITSIICLFILSILVLTVIEISYLSINKEYDFVAFFTLLDLSLLIFMFFFLIYIFNYGPTLLNFYHNRLNKSIGTGNWKNNPDAKNKFYEKYKPYINLVIRLQIIMNLLAILSVILLLAAFILLDVILSLPSNISFTNYFLYFAITNFLLVIFIIIFYHIFKLITRKRYEKRNWNYSIIYSFLLSNLNREINQLINGKANLKDIKYFIINIKKKYSDEEKRQKKNLDKKYDNLKGWIKIWISPILVLLWSLFIVFIPTIVLWLIGIKNINLNYNPKLMITFIILLILVFYYFVSTCLFYFFIFNNFQLHKNEDEKEAKNQIRRIIFRDKKTLNQDNVDVDSSLSKTKLFFILGILRKIFQDFEFNEIGMKKEYLINIKDKIYDLTIFDNVYKKLYGEGTVKNYLYLSVSFNEQKDFEVIYNFKNKID